MKPITLTGLVAAAHTPFADDGELKIAIVEKQAAHFLNNGISVVFIGGSTGESHSLSLEERKALTKQWMSVTRQTPMKVIVHVGSNCLGDARMLAAQAQKLGALAVSALAPSYFKPRNVSLLVGGGGPLPAAGPGGAG